MHHNLKGFVALAVLAIAACEGPADLDQPILLYCDAQTTKPVTLTDENGEELEGTLNYRGYYRIDIPAETLEIQFIGGDGRFFSACRTEGPCKLTSNNSEIRFENPGRRWENKVIDETHVFERKTGYLTRTTEITEAGETTTEYATGHCKPMEDIDGQLF